ncbi:hypothetical protein B296_00054556, partial [Ensete ventricosum]
ARWLTSRKLLTESNESDSGEQQKRQRRRRRATTMAESSGSGERLAAIAASDGNRVDDIIAIRE